MAFPTTSVLTTFTGPDENPLSEGGNWAEGPDLAGEPAARVSNQAKNSVDTTNNKNSRSYWVASQFGPDLEAYATIASLPNSGKGVAVWGRIHNPTASYEAYLAVYTTGTGFRLFKVTAGGTFAQLGSTAAVAASVGDKIGLECIGTTIRCLHFTGGSWVQRVSATDSTISGAGYIAIEFSSNDLGSGKLDDFGGGTVSGAATVTGSASLTLTAGITTAAKQNHFAAATQAFTVGIDSDAKRERFASATQAFALGIDTTGSTVSVITGAASLDVAAGISVAGAQAVRAAASLDLTLDIFTRGVRGKSISLVPIDDGTLTLEPKEALVLA